MLHQHPTPNHPNGNIFDLLLFPIFPVASLQPVRQSVLTPQYLRARWIPARPRRPSAARPRERFVTARRCVESEIIRPGPVRNCRSARNNHSLTSQKPIDHPTTTDQPRSAEIKISGRLFGCEDSTSSPFGNGFVHSFGFEQGGATCSPFGRK